MPRTATTFHQNIFFPEIKGLTYHQLPGTHFRSDFQRLLYQDEALFDSVEVYGSLRTLVQGDTLFSNENFIGQSLFMAHGNRSRTAKRLSESFPEAEVILFLRGQPGLLRSLYSIGVSGDVSLSPDEFIFSSKGGYQGHGADWHEYARYNTLEMTEHLEGYRYKEMLDLYNTHFKKVHVFLFEDFQKDPEPVMRRLVDILGAEWKEGWEQLTSQRINRSMDAAQLKTMMRINKWSEVVRGHRLLEALWYRAKRKVSKRKASAPLRFSDDIERSLTDYFSETNRDLLAAYPEIGINAHPEAYPH